MKKSHKVFDIEFKESSGDGSEFEGYANIFYYIDSAREIVAKGAFTDNLPLFLKEGFIAGLNHDWNNPIGSPIEATETEKGLFVKGKICNTSHGNDVKVWLKDGIVKKMSIGYQVIASQWLETPDAVLKYWKDVNYTPSADEIAQTAFGARLLTKIKLFEFSPVMVPANNMADITRVKSLPAELSLGEHSQRLLDDVKEWCERIKSLKELRRLDQREIGKQRKSDIEEITALVKNVFDSLLELKENQTETSLRDANSLFASLLETNLRLSEFLPS